MGIIYKIYNDINDKVYIGQTIQDLKDRWQKHKSCAKTNNAHLYRAMRLYGTEHFNIIPIENNVANELLDEREIYWISFYNSFECGYNDTRGGDTGSFPFSIIYQYDLSGTFIRKYEGASEAERITGCLHQNILKVCKGKLRQCGGFLWSFEQTDSLVQSKPKREKYVYQYDSDFNLIKVFNTVKEASESIGIYATHLSRACRSKYKCHGYYWSYEKEIGEKV